MARPEERVTLLIPVFNDWAAADLMLGELDGELARAGITAHVVLVDDGSTEPLPAGFLSRERRALGTAEIVSLRRNLGHQRAIAIGLAFVQADRACDTVVVMDADGEDAPSDVPRLLQSFREHGGTHIVFAARRRRSERLWFRLGYHAFRLVHRILVGLPVKVGNFSVLSGAHLERLVVVSEVWNHYAAAVLKARLPHDTVDTARGRRLAGRSSMSLVSSVVHGLSAMAVYGEIIGVRLLVTTVCLIVLAATLFGAFLLRTQTGGLVPLWAMLAAGTMLVILAQAVVMVCVFVFVVLGSRAGLSFLPIRDYRFFLGDIRTLGSASNR